MIDHTVEPDTPDEELVTRVLDGDTASYGKLMQRYNQRLFRVAVAILRAPDEAKDVIQDAYVRAYSRLEKLDNRSCFGTWLTAIVVNESCTRLRRLKREGSLEEKQGKKSGMTWQASEYDPEQIAAGEELRHVLEQAIEQLTPIYRVTFILREVEEMSVADTATSLGVSEDSVRTRAHRARRLLKRTLEEQFGGAIHDLYPFRGAECERLCSRVLHSLQRDSPGRTAG